MGKEIARLDFNWHDELAEGDYRFGEDGYLVMDGSRGQIRCNRKIDPQIDSADSSLELCIRIVLQHTYQICLYDDQDRLAVACRIDPHGWIRFLKDDQWEKSEQFLTYCFGVPTVDPEFNPPNRTRDSDEVTFRFEGFEFSRRIFRFSANGEVITMENAFQSAVENISRVEFLTPRVEAGTVLRLRSLVHRKGNEVLEREEFPWRWEPVTAPHDGYNYDHISSIRLFPKEYRWLQSVTPYGWAKVRIPKLEEGELEYDLMTPDVERESALLLEESHPTVEQGCRAHTGIARGKFMCAGPEERYSEMVDSHFKQDRLFYFDSPIPKPNQVYRIRVGWDPRGYRIWIDGEQMRLESGEIFPFEMPEKSFVGIDTLTIHPGMGGTRLTLSEQRSGKRLPEEIPEPHVAYWGNIRVTNTSDGD